MKDNKNQNAVFRPADLILILILFLCGLCAFAFLKMYQQPGKTVCITIDGKIYGEYPLDKEQEIAVNTGSHENIVMIKNGQANVTHADCPDKICVNHKPISKEGETIVCLPHKVVVEILGESDKNDFDVIVE